MGGSLFEAAEAILLANTLNDKFIDLRPFVAASTEAHQGLFDVTTLAAPGRPIHLRFDQGERAPFPKGDAPYERGMILHFFANHELLALELMALCLLKFPRMPKHYRDALIYVIHDEQKHLRAYLTRMEQFGVSFGDLRLSGFFWRQMSVIDCIESFAAAMHLTFEQANLDFAYSYKERMQLIGDPVTASLLEQVLLDEIAHVGLGLRFVMSQKKDPHGDDFSYYSSLLPQGVSPRRARGDIFVRKPRLDAGFSETLCDAFAVYSESRGRPMQLYYFNGAAEWQKGGKDLSPLAMLYGVLAHNDDMVAVLKQVPDSYLLAWQSLALPSVKPVVYKQAHDLHKALKWPIELVQPWVPHNDISQLLTQEKLPFRLGLTHELERLKIKQTHYELFARKDALFMMGESPYVIPQKGPIYEPDAITEALFKDHPVVVIKALYGGAGQMHALWDKRTGPFTLNKPWLKRSDVWAKGVIIEPWLPKCGDGSVLFQIDATRVKLLGVTSFYTDAFGRYVGHDLAPFGKSIPGPKRQAFQKLLRDEAATIAKYMQAKGFEGRCGIDFIVQDREDPRFLFNEINPRDTMGHMALAFAKRLKIGDQGLFKVVKLDHQIPHPLPLSQDGFFPHGLWGLSPSLEAGSLAAVIDVKPSSSKLHL